MYYEEEEKNETLDVLQKHVQRLVPMVFNRCAMQINVEFANWVWMVFWTLKSVSTSTLLVASS